MGEPAISAPQRRGPCLAGSGPRPWAPRGIDRVTDTLITFYQVERAGAARLSGGGGPFGFDVTVALMADDLLTAYDCDVVVETGSHMGDTTAYLGRRYRDLPVLTCDIDPEYASFTAHRVKSLTNVAVTCQDSPALVAAAAAEYERPLFYLDAHWGTWPLMEELAAIRAGIVLIDDFDIGHRRFSYDVYDGIACGPDLLAAMQEPPDRYWTPDPEAVHPLPCLQVGRRPGVGITMFGLDSRHLDEHFALIGHDLTRAVTS